MYVCTYLPTHTNTHTYMSCHSPLSEIRNIRLTCARLYLGSMQALLRLYWGSIEALCRLYFHHFQTRRTSASPLSGMVCIYMYICIYVCIHIYIHTYKVCVCVREREAGHLQRWAIYAYMYMYMFMHIYTYIHTYIHTYIYIYIYI